MPRTQYPKEVGNSIRPNAMFSITSALSAARAEDNEHPLMVYSGFSRFVVTIVDNVHSNEKKIVTANIPIDYMESIFRRTEFAANKNFEAEITPKGSGSAAEGSKAFTVKIASGAFKGKTPAEVLMENPGALESLKDQYRFLRQNLEKYPRNKTQMDAIEEAANLLKEGKLSGAEEQTAIQPEIEIYNAEARSLIRKAREDGMCPVYEIHITWKVGDRFPVAVNIVNFYAPVNKLEGGRINPVISQKDQSTFKSVTYKLAEWEWLNMIRSMKTNMAQFEVANAKACIADADAAEKKNREEATN